MTTWKYAGLAIAVPIATVGLCIAINEALMGPVPNVVLWGPIWYGAPYVGLAIGAAILYQRCLKTRAKWLVVLWMANYGLAMLAAQWILVLFYIVERRIDGF